MAVLLTISSNALPAQAQEVVRPSVPQKNSGSSTDLVAAPGLTDGESSSRSSSSVDTHDNSFRLAPKHFLFDQKGMWTSPAKIRIPDATWLVPLGGFAAGLLVTDSDSSRHLNNAPSTLHHYQQVSNYGVGAMAGVGGGLYLLGLATHNEHQRETGFLSGEAAVDSLVAVEALKYMTRRERPLVDNANGSFWSGGDSFPSEHAAAAWSIAGVIAHEYPGPLPKLAAYGAASAISAARVTGKKHFPSDVLVGSAIGWLVGQYVYRTHHSPELVGGEWGMPGIRPEEPHHWEPNSMGSPYVPLDSWIYPAITRLAALGYIKSDFEGMRPWTRMECARLIQEAADHFSETPSETKGAGSLYESLAREFSKEINLLGGGDNRAAQLESVYARVTGISGQPLTDGFHFGQTINNDYGRPYQEGFNDVTGFSGWASDGPFVGYLRGEFQHAPSGPALPLTARQFISGADGPTLPLPPATGAPRLNQFELLDGYVGMNFDNWQLSYGKQSLWWGPGEGGPMMFSNNADPVNMIQLNRVSPFRLSSVLGWLGPMRLDFFLGQVAGHDFINVENQSLMGQWGIPLSRQPFIHGEKLSFKPTSNFEFSVSETTLFAGGPIPLNGHNFLKSYLGFIVAHNVGEVDITDPRSSVDFTYRIPWLRNRLSLFGDAFTEDEYSPLAYPRKSAFQGGIYLPRVPGVPKLDLHIEGGSTSPTDFQGCAGCFYQNGLFVNSYTNRGNLMGTWIGRASQGEQAWSTYWITSRDTIQFNYRHREIDSKFIPNGGTVNDGGVKTDIWLNTTTELSGSVQFEKWNIPVLAATSQSNWTTSIGIRFWPREAKRPHE